MQDRVNGPGIALMVVGALAILYALVSVPLNIVNFAHNPALQENNFPLPVLYGAIGFGALIFLIVGVLIIVGGMKMRAMQSYGLAMAAAILAMVPCCDGMCCIVGLPIGIWALVVLMDQQVKQSFTS